MLLFDAERLPRRRPGPRIRVGPALRPTASEEVLNALEGADAALISLGADMTMHRHLSFQENAMVELAVERERIRQEFRQRDATAACGTVVPLSGRRK